MRSVSEKNWERTIVRYLNAHAIPIKWDGLAKRFTGIKGHCIARINPRVEQNAWALMPQRLRQYEAPDRNSYSDNVILLVTNRMYGDSVDDTIVVMRLGTFIPMLKEYTKGGSNAATGNR